MMVVFDSTPAAAAAALAMQRAVDECDDPVQLRVGVAAKRLCDAADAGEVLVSEAARGLVADSAIDREQLGPAG